MTKYIKTSDEFYKYLRDMFDKRIGNVSMAKGVFEMTRFYLGYPKEPPRKRFLRGDRWRLP